MQGPRSGVFQEVGERTVDGCLTAQLLEHFGGLGQSVTGFTNGDVEDEFLDAQLAHGVGALVFAGFRLHFQISSMSC